jgi:hypothetical protein
MPAYKNNVYKTLLSFISVRKTIIIYKFLMFLLRQYTEAYPIGH